MEPVNKVWNLTPGTGEAVAITDQVLAEARALVNDRNTFAVFSLNPDDGVVIAAYVTGGLDTRLCLLHELTKWVASFYYGMSNIGSAEDSIRAFDLLLRNSARSFAEGWAEESRREVA